MIGSRDLFLSCVAARILSLDCHGFGAFSPSDVTICMWWVAEEKISRAMRLSCFLS